MRHSRFTAVLAAILVSTAAFAAADTLQIASYGTTAATPSGIANSATTYGSTAATYDVGSTRSWGTPLGVSSWVSFDPNAYPGGSSAPANGTYIYNSTFTLSGGTFSGVLYLMADDNANVSLNGLALTSVNSVNPGLSTIATYILPSADLVSGLNTLTFNVLQVHGGATGLDYSGAVTVTPEPPAFLLLGTGLLSGIALLRSRRRSPASPLQNSPAIAPGW